MPLIPFGAENDAIPYGIARCAYHLELQVISLSTEKGMRLLDFI
jgi:hypothetical protein